MKLQNPIWYTNLLNENRRKLMEWIQEDPETAKKIIGTHDAEDEE